MIKDIVNLDACNLLLHSSAGGLYPKNVFLIALHQLHDAFYFERRWDVARHAGLDKLEFVHVRCILECIIMSVKHLLMLILMAYVSVLNIMLVNTLFGKYLSRYTQKGGQTYNN